MKVETSENSLPFGMQNVKWQSDIICAKSELDSLTDASNDKIQFSLTSNPSSGKFGIRINRTRSILRVDCLDVFAINGKLVYSRSDYNLSEIVDVSFLSSGMYVVRIRGLGSIENHKLNLIH